LAKGSGVLRSESFDEMTARPDPWVRIAHGLGYWTGNDRDLHLVGASGDSGSFHSVMMAFPDRGLGYFTLVSGGGNAIAWDFYGKFPDAVFGRASTSRSEFLAPISIHDLRNTSRFAGFYRTVRYPHQDISKVFITTNLTRTTLDSEGALRVYGARWLPIGPLEFRKENGNDRLKFELDSNGRVRFMNDSDERIAWYEVGYAGIAFYVSFALIFLTGALKSTRITRWASGAVLLHCVGWLAIALIVGPANLIFGLPLALKCVLLVGTVLPVIAIAAVYSAYKHPGILPYVVATAIVAYIPFVNYWNLKL
jgi:uncharacterized membrane protein YhdT